MKLYTIGFTQKSAETFFTTLRDSGATRLIDVRLNNVSQLAAFAKRNDLAFFLREICGMDYLHAPDLAPTQDLLDSYKKAKGAWRVYEQQFLDLLRQRGIESTFAREQLASACLLCSEPTTAQCHRRLVAEYLRDHWGGVEIIHL